MLDVLVVGGGPAGSYLASQLAARGHSVAVLEKKEKTGERVCCTGIVSHQCVSEFCVDDGVIIRWFNSASLFSPSGQRIRLQRQERQACVVDRAAFDEIMARRAIAAGADFKLGHSVEGILPDENSVVVSATHNGEKVSLRARVAVVAAGFNPFLIKSLGLGQMRHFAIGAQAEVEAGGLQEVEIRTGRDIAPGSFAWLVPLAGGRARAGLLAKRQPQLYLRKFIDRLVAEARVEERDYRIESRPVPLKPVPRSYGQRLILLGDSAGQVKPTTGGGIYYGLLCARIAADTLHQALEVDELSASDLAVYEKRWKELLGEELSVGRLARLFYERLSDRQIETAFGILSQGGLIEDMLDEEELTFDWHGRVILSLARRRVLARVSEVLQMPIRIATEGIHKRGK